MQRYEWNTGRHYSPEGQRIVAEVTDERVAFYDFARGIYGTLPLPQYGELSDALRVRSYVMAGYDRNTYSSGHEAHGFFMRIINDLICGERD